MRSDARARAEARRDAQGILTPHLDILLEEFSRACELIDNDHTHENRIVDALRRCVEEAPF